MSADTPHERPSGCVQLSVRFSFTRDFFFRLRFVLTLKSDWQCDLCLLAIPLRVFVSHIPHPISNALLSIYLYTKSKKGQRRKKIKVTQRARQNTGCGAVRVMSYLSTSRRKERGTFTPLFSNRGTLMLVPYVLSFCALMIVAIAYCNNTSMSRLGVNVNVVESLSAALAAPRAYHFADAASIVQNRRCANNFGNYTVQISGSWLEFCPCGEKAMDAIDGNDNGCISIQVAKFTTTDSSQKVYTDNPPTPFSSTISTADIDPNGNIVYSTIGTSASKGMFLPTPASGQNFYAVSSSNVSAANVGVSVDIFEANYGSSVTLTGVIVTGGGGSGGNQSAALNNRSLAGTLYYNGANTQRPLRVGDRMFYLRCKEGRDILDHNVYLRVKVFGQPSNAIANYATEIANGDFFEYMMTTNTMTPPQQISYDDFLYAPQYGRMMEVADVFGAKWVKVMHHGDSAHPIQNSAEVSPTFVFGVGLLPATTTGPTTTRPTPPPTATNASTTPSETTTATTTTTQTTTQTTTEIQTNSSTTTPLPTSSTSFPSTTTTAIDATNVTSNNNTTSDSNTTQTSTAITTTTPPLSSDANESNSTTDAANTTEEEETTTTQFSGGAAGRRTTTPIPAAAPPRGGVGLGSVLFVFVTMFLNSVKI